MENSEKKIALVTGANKGIGKETAKRLAALGMTVLVSARNAERGNEAVKELKADGADVSFLQLDVTDEASVKAAAASIEKEFGRLDVLVNNAGVAGQEGYPPGKPSEIGADQMRKTYETNVFGVVAVMHAMVPLLKLSGAGRIVNLSSPLASLTFHADPEHPIAQMSLLAYNSSKSALNAITLHYANELRGTGILVNAANPGYVATDLNNHAGHKTVEEGATIVVELATLGEGGPTGTFKGDDGVVPW